MAFNLTAFTIAAFAASTAVAILAWAAAFAATLAATTFTALFHIAFTTFCTLAACRAFATGLYALGVALIAAFDVTFVAAICAALWTVPALSAVTTTATATTTAASAIGAAAITALAAFAWLFVAHGWLGFFF